MARPSKDFEAICLERMKLEEEAGRGTMGRYGVMSSFFPDRETGVMTWQPVQSLPDFEGIIPPLGRQFVTDAKYTAAASVELRASHFPERQLAHMFRRSEFGAVCFLLIHFAGRELVTRDDPPETWAFPVFQSHPFWIAFSSGVGSGSINRSTAALFGVPVPWTTSDRGRKPRPDILAAVQGVAKLIDGHAMAEYPALPEPKRKRRRLASAVDADGSAAF